MSEQRSGETRADFWRAQIDAWQASGQSQVAYCEANALSYARFVYWRRKFRRPTVAERSILQLLGWDSSSLRSSE